MPKQLQKKMAEAQDKLNEIEVEGTSGGGLVKVTSTAKGTFLQSLVLSSTMGPGLRIDLSSVGEV